MFEHTGRIGSNIAIALQFRIGNLANLRLHVERHGGQTIAYELPDSSLLLGHGHDTHAQ